MGPYPHSGLHLLNLSTSTMKDRIEIFEQDNEQLFVIEDEKGGAIDLLSEYDNIKLEITKKDIGKADMDISIKGNEFHITSDHPYGLKMTVADEGEHTLILEQKL